MKQFQNKYFKYLFLAAIIYMPIFGHLDTLPIRIWDESRLAMNAYEMYHDGNFIVTHFEGKPDMWNTKPPLLIWFQVICMKILGVNELSVRLPSAIAAFLTCIALLLFSFRYLKSFWFGFISVVLLITFQGYINIHATRTGDYDALLTLFTTLSGLSFFAFSETRKTKYLYLFFTNMVLAVLTKSVVGLLFIPAFVIYCVWQKQFLLILTNKHFYIGLFSFLFLVIGYYLLREFNNPGYIKAVQANELGERFLNVVENHHQERWFYYHNFINFQLSGWYILIPCGLMLGFVNKNPKINRLTLFALWMIIIYFSVITASKTKIEWYDVPLYPFISILITVFIYYIFSLLQNITYFRDNLRFNIIPYLFLFLICITPYQRILDKTFCPKESAKDAEFYEIGYYLKDAIKGKVDVNGQCLAYDGYISQNLFYIKILKDQGVNVFIKDWKLLDQGDVVIAPQYDVKKYIEENYSYAVIKESGNVKTYKIYVRK